MSDWGPPVRTTIESLGTKGEGVATVAGRRVFAPYTVPGDTVDLRIAGERGTLVDIVAASAQRVAPICPYWTRCGGCATQTVELSEQLAWKRDLVIAALTHAGLDAPVDPCRDAHGAGRRRATFHARRGEDGRTHVGFMAARSHDLVAIDHCPLFAPRMSGAVDAAQAIAITLAATGKPLDIAVTATDGGLDVDVRGTGPLDDNVTRGLVAAAKAAGLVRVSNHGRTAAAFRTPSVMVDGTGVEVPPGGFLQATEAGEATLATLVCEAAVGAKRVADLFSGIGTFALPLARHAAVHALEADGPALDACLAAARAAGLGQALTGERRDLARRPLSADELNGFEAVVFDPPRAGAVEQVTELGRARVPLIIGVSCNPQTFARDATLLCDGGYTLDRVTPVDQFRHSAHVELVGIFRRAKVRRRRSLLG